VPANPDSLILRYVQVDAPADKPWDEPVHVETDGFQIAAVFLTEVGKDDRLVGFWCDGNDLRLRDVTNPGTADGGYTLSELLAGGAGGLTEEAHKALRQLIHFIEDGPAEGFASGAYREVTGTVFPTAFTWYTSSAKTAKIVERLITWSGVNATVDKWKVYDTDGTTVLWTISDAINYSGVFETDRTRTITPGDA
jgi:hypothetical protein